ncbi:MAG: energy transducer TonB [Parafilimonas sp.]
MYDTLTGLNTANDVNHNTFKYPIRLYYSATYNKTRGNAFPKINASIILTVDSAGSIANTQFKSNLTEQQINKINYYFSRISNLAPRDSDTEKTIYNVNIKLDMLIDTLKNDSFHVSYLIFNADSMLETDLSKYIDTSNTPEEDYYKVFTSAQVEAKFPGDWNKFLERNLNAQVPADKGAPPGRYSVTVSFLVDTRGKISEIKAENDPGYGTAEEAVRVIKNGPDWQPAIQNGKKVIYRQKQNIVFEVTKE